MQRFRVCSFLPGLFISHFCCLCRLPSADLGACYQKYAVAIDQRRKEHRSVLQTLSLCIVNVFCQDLVLVAVIAAAIGA